MSAATPIDWSRPLRTVPLNERAYVEHIDPTGEGRILVRIAGTIARHMVDRDGRLLGTGQPFVEQDPEPAGSRKF